MNHHNSPAAAPTFRSDGAFLPPTWQAVLVFFSLGLVSLFLALPLLLTLLLIWTSILIHGGLQGLEAVGALEPGAYGGAIYLATAMLTLAATTWGLGRLASAKHWALGRKIPTPLGDTQTSWAARHPWILAGVACALIDLVLLPIDRAKLVDIPDGLVGAGILGAVILLDIAASVALFRGFWLLLRAIWRGTRRSPFFAGVVSAASLSAVLTAYLFGSALIALLKLLPAPVPQPTQSTCTRSTLECSRQTLLSAAQASHAATSASLRPSEQKQAFDACVEELHREDPIRGNAYRDALAEARLRVLDPAEAEDVVHDTIMAVCLSMQPRIDIRSYFIRSVRNNAGKAARRNRRFCPIVPEPIDWPPDGCITRSVEQQIVQLEMEAAAHDSMCSLERTDRTVIQLHVWDNLPHREIGRKLGLSPDAARQRYHRALESLKGEFQQRCR